MTWVYDDGGRKAAGFKGEASDCVVRAIAIAYELPYLAVYECMNEFVKSERITKRHKTRSSARTGVAKATTRRFMAELGWTWVPTMGIGTGTTVHLRADELPTGHIITKCSRHVVAVINGVIHDTHDPSRGGTRAVYGYWHPNVHSDMWYT
jgi:hypothetical protein